MEKSKIAIIGGGAAGFFAAINIAEKTDKYDITIFEKSNKLLSKVLISGGGRCNVTNERTQPSELVHFYPRGGKKLYSLFKRFSPAHMREWLYERGISTTAEVDGRVFPTSNNSKTIVNYFIETSKKLGVKVLINSPVTEIQSKNGRWEVQSKEQVATFDKLIFATGSSNAAWGLLKSLDFTLTSPVPSLFTFNIKDPRIEGLQGVSFEKVSVKVVKSKLEESGPLLITHWGLSGPAVLKLSSWGARDLYDLNYQFQILVNYLGDVSNEKLKESISNLKKSNPKKKLVNKPLFELPKRFWNQVLIHCEISENQTYGELSKKRMNKLVEELTQGRYHVSGKSTFKEEFVTAGGVKLSEVSLDTFECKKHPNFYLAGEVLDIDALTGGFNFQACWSAGWCISEHLSQSQVQKSS